MYLLCQPQADSPLPLVLAASETVVDPSVSTDPVSETYKAIRKIIIKSWQASSHLRYTPRVCRVDLFRIISETETVPEEWMHRGIIIALYKGKGSYSGCHN